MTKITPEQWARVDAARIAMRFALDTDVTYLEEAAAAQELADAIVHIWEAEGMVTGEDTEPMVRYPDVHVRLSGADGNAVRIIGSVTAALKREHGAAGIDEAAAYVKEAMAGDYDHLLQVTMRTVVTS